MSKLLFNIAYTLPTPPGYLVGKRRADYLARRQFYSMTAEYNILSYMLKKEKVCKNKDILDYYTRGTNTGLFDNKKVLDELDVKKLKAELAETKSIIWHGFLSFDAETSKGFQTQENAIKFLNQSFMNFLDKTHLNRDNVKLFAVLHTDTPHHHHIHFSFFEHKPTHINKNGNIQYTQRGSIDSTLIDNYLISANMHLNNSNDYWTTRDKAMAGLRGYRSQAFSDREIRAKFLALKQKLPQTGRLQYGARNIAPFRTEIDELVKILINKDKELSKNHKSFLFEIAKKEQEVKKICAGNKLSYMNNKQLTKTQMKELILTGKVGNKKEDTAQGNDYMENLKFDYKKRLGNQVLAMIKFIDYNYSPRKVSSVNDKEMKIEAKKRRNRIDLQLKNLSNSLKSQQQTIRMDFQKTLKQIEQQIENERMTS